MAPKMHLGENRARPGQDVYLVPSCGNRRSKQVTTNPLDVDCQSCERTSLNQIEKRAQVARMRHVEEIELLDDGGEPSLRLALPQAADQLGEFHITIPKTLQTIQIRYDQLDELRDLLRAASALHGARKWFAGFEGELTEEAAIASVEQREAERPDWERNHRGDGHYWKRHIGHPTGFRVTKGGPDNA